MKRELDEDISWGKIFLKVTIAFIIVILIIWLVSKFLIKNSNEKTTEFESNLQEMYNAAEKYFEEEENLPQEGKINTITLKEMIEEGLIDELKDGKTLCNTKNSYAKMTNKKGEYTLKVLLTCGANSDYISKVINPKTEEELENTTTIEKQDDNKTNDNQNKVPSTNQNQETNTEKETEVIITDYTKLEYKFCKIEYKNYYTNIYLNHNDLVKGYTKTYTIKLNDLENITNVSVLQDNYFLYRKYYETYQETEENFTIINGNSSKNLINNTNNFIKYSLKSNNFDYELSDIYTKDNEYYIDITITITKEVSNYLNSNGTKINFIPIYFRISYGTLDNCIKDNYSNVYKYSGYYVIK